MKAMKNKMEILKLKDTITKYKAQWMISKVEWMDRTKGKKISQLDNRAIEITQSKEQRKNELKKKKMNRASGSVGQQEI